MTDDESGDGAVSAPAVPDLGFFAGPPAPGQQPSTPLARPSTFGPPAASMPSTPSAPSFGAPVQSQFGTPVEATPFGSGAPFGSQRPVTAPAPAKRQMPGWAIVVLAVAGGLAVLAAVGLPFYHSLHDKGIAAHTTVSMPDSAGDFTKVSSAQTDNLSQFLSGDETVSQVQIGVYQRGSVQVAVVAAKATTSLTMADQTKVMSDFSNAIEARTGFPATLAPIGTSLAGIFGCSQVEQSNNVGVACLSTSPGAVVALVFTGEDYDPATTDARTLLEAVEHQG
jgi:hypothetical protein